MLNKTTLIGRLGADPELRQMPDGNAVCNISLATGRTWKDKNTGEKQEETEWHRVVFFNRTAEVAGEYLKKGSQIYVEGRNKTRKWTDNDGVDRYSTEIIANSMQMLDTKSESSHGKPPPHGSNQQQSQPQQQRQQPQQQMRQSQQPNNQNMPPEPPQYEDDIPF